MTFTVTETMLTVQIHVNHYSIDDNDQIIRPAIVKMTSGMRSTVANTRDLRLLVARLLKQPDPITAEDIRMHGFYNCSLNWL